MGKTGIQASATTPSMTRSMLSSTSSAGIYSAPCARLAFARSRSAQRDCSERREGERGIERSRTQLTKLIWLPIMYMGVGILLTGVYLSPK